MSVDAVVAIALLALVWIGWPLHSIAHDMRAVRKMAERSK